MFCKFWLETRSVVDQFCSVISNPSSWLITVMFPFINSLIYKLFTATFIAVVMKDAAAIHLMFSSLKYFQQSRQVMDRFPKQERWLVG